MDDIFIVPDNVVDYFVRLKALMKRCPDVLTVDDVAEFLKINPKRLRDSLASGASYGRGWKVNSRYEYYINSPQFYMNCTQDWARAGILKFGGEEDDKRTACGHGEGHCSLPDWHSGICTHGL